MEFLTDATALARFQFAATAIYHCMFVPLSVGFGMVLAILQTKAYRTQDAHDKALARFWLKLFTGTFAVGVATGITMEFSFGTNWADYARFVGDIFGAPLAAEALFAFFLESVFLGVLLFGRDKVSEKFYLVSAWLVWLGSCFSALWIIIANSWMQTPAGYAVVTENGVTKAVLTSFAEAAFNPSTLQRYAHTVLALLITGAFVAIAVGAYYLLKNKNTDAGKKLMKLGFAAGLVTTVLMLPAAHAQAVVVAEEQPSKLAAMEGQYESGPAELSLFGWVDEGSQETFALSIPGGTSFLATGNFDAEYPGLNDFAADERPDAVNLVFQTYHIMVAMFGLIVLVLIAAFLASRGKCTKKWLLRFMLIAPAFPLLAIQTGWITAEMGRQPWIVFGELKTADAISLAVDPWMLIITLVLFAVVYALIYVLWLKSFFKTVRRGPDVYLKEGAGAASAPVQAQEVSA